VASAFRSRREKPHVEARFGAIVPITECISVSAAGLINRAQAYSQCIRGTPFPAGVEKLAKLYSGQTETRSPRARAAGARIAGGDGVPNGRRFEPAARLAPGLGCASSGRLRRVARAPASARSTPEHD
jgi:hypothetical protein